jgi:MFS family permease
MVMASGAIAGIGLAAFGWGGGGMWAAVAAAFAAGLAASWLVIRFMFGVGEAGAFPNSSGSISRWFPAVERARAQGVVWMATRIGAASLRSSGADPALWLARRLGIWLH